MMKKNAGLSKGCHKARKSLYLAVAAASHLMISTQVLAGPEGGLVIGGSGTIDQSGVDTIIHQASERLAIDWKSFNVGIDERVEFIQPSSSSIALNRVLSHNGSEIHGRIDANGHVFLVNPNGVFFGENSQINVGGIIASGLSIEPSRFMNGDYALQSLEGTEGRVINHGIINAATGGSVTLVGQQVRNEGFISANLGTVNLAAGNEAVLTFDARGLVGVKVTEAVLQNDLGVDAAVINKGEIQAQGGRVLLTASVSEDIFSQAVNHGGMNKTSSVVVHEDGSFTLGAGADVINTGEINVSVNTGEAGQVVLVGENITNSGGIFADTEQGVAGHIELHSVDTTLLTQNAKVSAQTANQGAGGDIKVLGNKVGLLDNAEVNASGANGGGQALIGGDETGSNLQVRNADFIYLGEASAVRVDALLNGNGGRLITFASDTARIHGELSARGGYFGGNGGFIETSGLEGFELTSRPDISAEVGKGGTWLIDPYSITIEEEELGAITPDDGNIFESTLTDSIVSTRTLEDALNSGGTVIIRTGGGGEGPGNITVRFPIAYNISLLDGEPQTATLRLEAHNEIIFEGSRFISRAEGGTGALNLELIANLDNNNANGGNIVFNSGSYVNTYGGNFYASGLDFTLPDANAIAINTGRATRSNRDVENNNRFLESNQTAGGNITLNMTGDVSIGSAVRTDGGNFIVENSSSFTNNFANSVIDTSNAFGGGDISIQSSGDIDLGFVDFTYRYSNAHTTGGNTTTELLRVGSVTATSAAGDITLSRELNFNDTGKRTGLGVDGHSDGSFNDQDTFLNLEATAGNITVNALISDALRGDARDALDITLTAGGNIDINADIYTAGGNFVASGHSFDSARANDASEPHYMINTDRANSLPGNDTTNNSGNATWSNGGNVEISASSAVRLGNITTDGSCLATASCTGNLSVAARNPLTESVSITQATNSILNINGTTTFDVGSGNINLANTNNSFHGDLTFTSANNVSITNTSDVRLDESNIGGFFTLVAGGDITQVEGTALTVAGTTTITATNHAVTLNNNRNEFSAVEFIGNIASLDLRDSDGNLSVSAVNTSGSTDSPGRAAGDITIRVDQGSLTTESLTANGAQITGMGLRAGGDITLQAQTAINVQGDISAIGAAGLDSRAGGAGGAISITSVGNDVSLSSVTTTGGNATNGNGNGGRGGSITLSASSGNGNITFANASGNTLRTGGGNGNGSGNPGDGGAVILTGNTRLSGLLTINTSGAGTGSRGDISFAGTVNSFNAPLSGLTLIGNQISFGHDVGAVSSLGAIDLNATSNLSAATYNFRSTSFDATTATGFSLGNIITAGANNSTGGTVSIVNTTGDVVVGAIDTRGGTATAAGRAGGNVAIQGSDIRVGAINTSGSNSAPAPIDPETGEFVEARPGGNAGTIAITAIDNAQNGTPSITLTGDLVARGGAGSGAGAEGSSRTAELRLEGGTSANGVIDFSALSSFLTANVDVVGSTGTDTLIGLNLTSIWTINGVGSGFVRNTSNPNTNQRINFSAIESLHGSNDFADSFLFSGTGSVANINGGTDSANTITGKNADSTWTITGATSGSIALTTTPDSPFTTFTNIQTLQGGSFADVFTITGAFSGAINGGSGNDTFHINAAVTGVIQGGIGNDTFNINVNSPGDIYGGGDDDIFNIAAAASNLYGEAGNDAFNFTSNTGSAVLISGGTGANDSITGRNANNVWTMTGANAGYLSPEGAAATPYVSEFREINTLIGGNEIDTLVGQNLNNTWNINGVNSGILRVAALGANFSGMENLVGSTAVDNFVFTTNTSNITGFINGGTNGTVLAGVNDTVDLTVFGNQGVKVRLGRDNDESTIDLINIETINAAVIDRDVAPTVVNHLYGASQADAYTWIIDGENTGTVAPTLAEGSMAQPEATTRFINFSAITGGDNADLFRIMDAGQISGGISGGGSLHNTADYSEKTGNLSVFLGLIDSIDGTAISEVSTVIGNAQNGFISRLTGFDDGNEWTLTVNEEGAWGNVNQLINFSGFTELVGGEGTDNFVATISPNTVNGRILLTGGGGVDNTVTINGGGSNFTATHGAATLGGGLLTYNESVTGNAYAIEYAGVGNVSDRLNASNLTINGTAANDVFTLGGNAYSINDFSNIAFTNKSNVVINASELDRVEVQSNVNLGSTNLTIHNAAVAGSANRQITARSLSLVNTAAVGSEENRLGINVNSLSVNGTRGSIYLNQSGALNLTQLNATELFDLTSNGSVTSTIALSPTGDFRVNTSAGDIILDNSQNVFSTSNLSLLASGAVNLRNSAPVTNLTLVRAGSLNVDSSGSITTSGPLTVSGVATFNAGGDIDLTNPNNSLNTVGVTSAANVSILSNEHLILSGVSASGIVNANSGRITVSGPITASALNLTAATGNLLVSNNVTTQQAVNLLGQGVTVGGNISAASIGINGADASVTLNGQLNSLSGDVVVAGNGISQSVLINSTGNVALTSTGNLTQAAAINATNVNLSAANTLNQQVTIAAVGDVAITAGTLQQQSQVRSQQGNITATVAGDIIMANNALSHSAQGNISYTAANMGISTLEAQAGTVSLNATQGAITNNNSTNDNVIAQRLVMDAISGIGANGMITTQVSELSASNFQGNISVENKLELVVDRLRTNGNISLVNTQGDVILDNTDGLFFSRGETDARLAGGTTNANYDIGTLSISVNAGSLLARGPQNLQNPDITAYNANLLASGEIGSAARPLVVYVKNNSVIFGRRSWGPLWGFGVQPANPVNNSIIQSNLSDLLAAGNEQLVEVETLDEVDPAIFTSVRNYFFDDISIMMPRDQRYEDDEEW